MCRVCVNPYQDLELFARSLARTHFPVPRTQHPPSLTYPHSYHQPHHHHHHQRTVNIWLASFPLSYTLKLDLKPAVSLQKRQWHLKKKIRWKELVIVSTAASALLFVSIVTLHTKTNRARIYYSEYYFAYNAQIFASLINMIPFGLTIISTSPHWSIIAENIQFAKVSLGALWLSTRKKRDDKKKFIMGFCCSEIDFFQLD